MGTIPTPPTFTAGAALTAASLNALRDVHNFWAAPPASYAYQSTAQTLTTGTWTALNLQSTSFERVQSGDAAMHDNVTNNTRITIRTPGKYWLFGQAQFVANATAYRMGRIVLNGATVLSEQHQGAAPTVSTSVGITPIQYGLSINDYVEIYGYQASGGNLDTLAGQSVTFLLAVLASS